MELALLWSGLLRERGSVCFGNTAISFDVRRSQRRKNTVQISVNGDGVQVAAPMTMPDGELRAIVRKRAVGYSTTHHRPYWKPLRSIS